MLRIIVACLLGSLALGTTISVSAQDDVGRTAGNEEDTYIPQAGGTAPSKVYFPDAITPESVAAARARAAQQQQLAETRTIDASLEQVSRDESGNREITQLSDRTSDEVLAQLSAAEREVLFEVIEGTDICDKPPDIAAIVQLCRTRIETRSGDFTARNENMLSAEERLLGEGLEDTGRPSIERVIERLARNVGQADDFDNQAIASVALTDQSPTDASAQDGTGNPGADLSPATQQLINALIQQLGGGGGG